MLTYHLQRHYFQIRSYSLILGVKISVSFWRTDSSYKILHRHDRECFKLALKRPPVISFSIFILWISFINNILVMLSLGVRNVFSIFSKLQNIIFQFFFKIRPRNSKQSGRVCLRVSDSSRMSHYILSLNCLGDIYKDLKMQELYNARYAASMSSLTCRLFYHHLPCTLHANVIQSFNCILFALISDSIVVLYAIVCLY